MKFKLIESKQDRQRLINHVGVELATEFFNKKHDIHDSKKKDLYYWLDKNPEELRDFLISMNKHVKPDYSDERWDVYNIKSSNMLNALIGRHIIWCIQNATSDTGLDWNYHVAKLGTKYQLYVDKLNNKRYLKGINDNNDSEAGVWGEDNLRVKSNEILNSMPEIEFK